MNLRKKKNINNKLLKLSKIIKKQNYKIKELSKSLDKATKSNKQKLEFISHLSHELKTPLNAIIGFTSLMNEAKLSKNKQDRFCQNILLASKYLLHLSEYTIDMARAETENLDLNYCKFNPTTVITEILAILDGQIAKKHLQLQTNFVNQMIFADKRRFTQLVYNLIGNAIKFNILGGFIKIKTKIKKNMFCFIVLDSGIGISKESQGKIFDFFTNIHDKKYSDEECHGIGLSLCKKIVNLHNGKIKFISRLNKGTIFLFELPINIHCK